MASNIYIDCNRQNSIINNSLTNNEWTYQLNEGLRIPKGTQIQINDSLLNVKGISGSTIEIEETILEEVRFYYYYTFSDAIKVARYSQKAYDPNIVNKYTQISEDGFFLPHNDFYKVILVPFNNSTFTGVNEFASFGYPNFPVILFSADNNGNLTPKRGQAVISIPKGKYTVDSLASIIEDQFMGRIGRSHLKDQLTDKNFISEKRESSIFDGYLDNDILITTVDVYNSDLWNSDGTIKTVTNADVANTSGIFLNVEGFNKVTKKLKQGQNYSFETLRDSGIDYYMCYDYIPRVQGGNHGFKENEQANYAASMKKMYIGTSDFTFSYDPVKSGFNIENLHQSYKQDSLNYKGIENSSPGNPITRLKMFPQNYFDDITKRDLLTFYSVPLSRIGGILVYNWAYSYCLSNTKLKFANNQAGIYLKDYSTFGDFFIDDYEQQWTNTLWYRLGFLYSQLQSEFNYEKWRVSPGGPLATLPGITSDADLDISLFNTIVGQPTANANGKSQIYQNYNWGTISYPYWDPGLQSSPGPVASQDYMILITVTYTDVLTKSQSLTGYRLPTLSTQGYYIITSDIVGTFKDNANRTELPILGIVPKSTTSSQDFISFINPLVHTTQQDKILNSIKIKVINPDLTDAELDKYSTVIVQITIPPEELLTDGQLKFQNDTTKK